MTVERYIGDRFFGSDSEKGTVLGKAKDGALFQASDFPFPNYVQESGAWQLTSSTALNPTWAGSTDNGMLTLNGTTGNIQVESAIVALGNKLGINVPGNTPTGRVHIYQSGDDCPALLVEGQQGYNFEIGDGLGNILFNLSDHVGLPLIRVEDTTTRFS